MDDLVVEHVLRAVEQLPAGRVASYGQVGGIVGIGPRQVGAIMSAYGSNVTWWRVTNASGELPAHLLDEARQRWAAEGILPASHGRGCDIRRLRADSQDLRTAYFAAVADLPPLP
ncbi:MAG: MGMT family protein [Micrococcales bacterium]|nr:MGMT family protein [Micrococcales bacterium]